MATASAGEKREINNEGVKQTLEQTEAAARDKIHQQQQETQKEQEEAQKLESELLEAQQVEQQRKEAEEKGQEAKDKIDQTVAG